MNRVWVAREREILVMLSNDFISKIFFLKIEMALGKKSEPTQKEEEERKKY